MMGRADQYRRFADRFHAGKRVRPATAAQLDETEAALAVVLPESYRQFALACGAVYAPTLADRAPGLSAPQQFLTPKQAVTETRRWKLDPGGGYVAFAADGSGNWFAFRQLPAAAPRPDDAAVWLFDLEDDAATVEAESFDAWVERFLAP